MQLLEFYFPDFNKYSRAFRKLTLTISCFLIIRGEDSMSTLTTLKKSKRLGFLATGSELVTGELLNTNSQIMADASLQHGIHIGEHILVDDDQTNIQEAFRFLLSRHDGVITTGGLGPTSDDLTRNAIAQVLNLELVFSPESYERILNRLMKKFGWDIHKIPKSNKNQAYFPAGSRIIPNLNGSADACEIKFKNKIIYLLPGPPKECLPLFSEDVLPSLLNSNFGSEKKLYRWRLQGVPEAQMAELLEHELKKYNLIFGYRAHSPYLDIKLNLSPGPDLEDILNLVGKLVRPYLIK